MKNTIPTTNSEDTETTIPYGFNTDGSVNHNERLFCGDQSCPDTDNQERIGIVGGWYQEGLVSSQDADNIYHNRIV